MDVGSLLGIILGLSAILLGNVLEGGHLSSLFQPTALLIVAGGTLGATRLGFPLDVFVKAVRALRYVFHEERRDTKKIIDEIVDYAQKARRDGIIALEDPLERASDAVCRLDADGGQRCERARRIRDEARLRVASCGCSK